MTVKDNKKSSKKEHKQASKDDVAVQTLVGDKLRKARKDKGYSIEDIAKRLKLREEVIENLEASIFDAPHSRTYMRGYLCSYVKLLGLNQNEILELLPSGLAESKIENKMKSFSRKTRRQARDHRVTNITWLVITILVGLTGAWWWQNHEDGLTLNLDLGLDSLTKEQPKFISVDQEDSALLAAPTKDEVIEVKELKSAAQKATEEQVLAEQLAEAKKQELAKQAAVEAKKQELAKQAAVEAKKQELAKQAAVEAKKQELAKQAAAEAKKQELAKQAAVEAKKQELAKQAAVEAKKQELAKQAAAEAKKQELAKQAAAEAKKQELTKQVVVDTAKEKAVKTITNPGLKIKFNQDCWIKVVDSKGRVLTTRVHKAGTTAFYKDSGFYKLIVGAPKGVIITYNGKHVDMQPYAKVKIARFTLGKK